MASQTEVVNIALTLLGETRVSSIDDDVKQARSAKALWNTSRDTAQSAYDWSFAMARQQLSPLADAPLFGPGMKFQIPSDCLRLVFIGDHYLGLDVTDYRGSPLPGYQIEGREILTDLGSPLNVRYIKRVTDVASWIPAFVSLFAAQLAMDLCEDLTQSDTKRQRATEAYKRALRDAIRVNAIEMPPQKLPDDEWIYSRL